MSNSYVDGKVREAIMAAKGSRATAQKLLMAWAVEDPDLLRGIAQPFLKAIAAAAIERAARPAASGGPARTRSGGAAAGARPSASGLSRDALENLLNQLGRDSEDGAADGTPGAGRGGAAASPEQTGAAGRPGGAGQGGGATHEKAMMAIAKAFVAKKIR